MNDDALSSELIPPALREALRLAPGNAPLLTHVAEVLLQGGETARAETLFRQALAAAPGNATAQLGLASAFYRQGKHSAALVLVEEMAKLAEVPPKARLLHARLALQAGDRHFAARCFRPHPVRPAARSRSPRINSADTPAKKAPGRH